MAQLKVKYVAGERHEHEKDLPRVFAEINEEQGHLVDMRHAAVNGPYERLMVSTVIVYEIPS